MSEDWNSGAGGRKRSAGRELSALRDRYAQHRQILTRLAAEAPTEHMAQVYSRVTAEIDTAVRKLDELEMGGAPSVAIPLATPEEPRPVHPAMIGADDRIDTREWRSTPAEDVYQGPPRDNSGLRKLIIALIAITAVALLGWFAWTATRSDDATPAIVEESSTAAAAEEQPTPAIEEAPLAAAPASYDFGNVAKGTRKAGRFQVTNNTDEAIPLAISRSQCRCLWFQHPQILPANSTATLTITVDGARAKAGTLNEIVTVSSKDNAVTSADIEITAEVQ